MANQKITEKVAGYLADFLEQEGLELYHVTFTKEGRDHYLSVYIDVPGEDNYVDVEDCEKVSQFLSDVLDREDPIESNYTLVVSSPGMDRELITDKHFAAYIGKPVDVKLYRAIDGSKVLTGELLAKDADSITIQREGDPEPMKLALADIAKVQAAVII